MSFAFETWILAIVIHAIHDHYLSVRDNPDNQRISPLALRRSIPLGEAREAGTFSDLLGGWRALGEDTANVLRSVAVAFRTCTVSFSGPSGIRHSVDVTAESVYEAAALGISALRQSGWVHDVPPGTELDVQVREPPTHHRITVQQIHRWCDGIAASPDEALKKRKLKQLFA